MTNEEAIDILKHNYPSACFTELCEAVDIAIKALSADPQPSETSKVIAQIIINEMDMRKLLNTAEPQRKKIERTTPGNLVIGNDGRLVYCPMCGAKYDRSDDDGRTN